MGENGWKPVLRRIKESRFVGKQKGGASAPLNVQIRFEEYEELLLCQQIVTSTVTLLPAGCGGITLPEIAEPFTSTLMVPLSRCPGFLTSMV